MKAPPARGGSAGFNAGTAFWTASNREGMVGLAAVALALGQAVSVQAIDPQELLAPIVGPVVILPHVSLSESYDDNVFLLSD